jgi:nucleolar protein 58
VLAAKCALSIRVDALTVGDIPSVGIEHRMAVENRLRQLEGGVVTAMSGSAKGKASAKKYNAGVDSEGAAKSTGGVSSASDMTVGKKDKKRKKEESDEEEEVKPKKSDKKEKEKKAKKEESDEEEEVKPKKKAKKEESDEEEEVKPKKSDKEKKSEKKKKKKKDSSDEDSD